MKAVLPPELHVINLHSEAVPYALKRSSKRRTVGLRVDRNGLTVNAPSRASKAWLENVLQQKAGWVLDKLREAAAREVPQQCWAEGTALPFLGGEICLNVSTGPKRLELAQDMLQVCMPASASQEQLQAQVIAWYRRQAMICFTERVAVFAQRLDVSVPKLRLSNAHSRWGSCSAKGMVSLSWRLIKAPLPVIDYVVAHELAHLKHMNHSAAFWRVVEQLYPDYAEVRATLREQGWRYHVF